MQYLNLDLDYFDHPLTIRLIGLLGRGAEILPIRLWVYAGKYLADTGKFIGFSPQEIESIAKWWGKEGAMLEAMLSIKDDKGKGFIEKLPNGYEIPNWLQINGHIAALKSRARAGAIARWKDYNEKKKEVYKKGYATGNAKPMLKQCSNLPTNLPTNLLTNLPNKDMCAFFEMVWKKYPKRIGRKQAERHFFVSVKTEHDKVDMEKALDNYLKNDSVKNGFIQNGSTWFNNWKDWIDYVEPVKPKGDKNYGNETSRKHDGDCSKYHPGKYDHVSK